ncbi:MULTISPECIES: AMP-binding protein [unclassified Streptomyces]|uniref:AMP-binding protein n=1 Tax=unclassified Streptomyces TaxID=2593676 RepID=UPI0022B69E5C|nr:MULTISPECIES: AMP-binding protein [unclassified Streptomyces]MCZ7416809.1 AMP-binding protein [Streptomyces sp. WMMC897]MCZ7433381.1 AMP-binding protein [Streptomyces sp. WMMC1477]
MDAKTAGNAAAALAATCAHRGWTTRPAFHENDTTVTHGEIHALAARVASVLADRGVTEGDRVCLALPDGIAWVATFLATARLGAVAVVTNPALTAADHARLVEDSGPVLAVTGEETAGHFPGLPCPTPEELLGDAADRPPAPAAPVSGDHPLYLQYTSGTTGAPKGVVHRHGDLERYHGGAGAQVLEIGPDDVLLSVSKLFFAYGLGNALAFPLCSGGAAVLEPGPPKPARIAELVARHRVTYLFAVPSAYANLLAETAPDAFSSVRAAVSAGERLTPELAERVTAFLGAPVYDQLGSTEAGHAIATGGPAHHVPGTIGRPVPGFEAEIRDRHGTPLPDGEAGELWVRGPTVTPGYHRRPDATARTIVDGWLNTRDRAVRNPDGTLVHHGRTDDLEMVGGITVSPVEIERLLARHPAVLDVAVAGVPDDRGATKLRAFVVLRPASAGADAVSAELLAAARAGLAPFKVPRSVEVVGALPRTATGKIQRYLLRRGAW